jgi:uncharacterized protein
MICLSELTKLAKLKEAENKKFFNRLRKSNPKDLDITVKAMHEKIFKTNDCLECANCCRSISPMITDKDIERMSKYLKMRPAVFTEKHLHMDKDSDYVFNDTPCPFLMADNYCSIYDARPKACSGYPHTNRKHFVQIFDITLKNTFICPAAYEVVEKLKGEYGQ